jgi:hypothetical protein
MEIFRGSTGDQPILRIRFICEPGKEARVITQLRPIIVSSFLGGMRLLRRNKPMT